MNSNIVFVYATKNAAKIAEAKRNYGRYGIEISSLSELGCNYPKIEETGETLEENAKIKVDKYTEEIINNAKLFSSKKIVVIADDTGLEIKKLGGEPGPHVRRWKNKKDEMSDDEIISYALERMADLKGSDRAAIFKTVLAVRIVNPGHKEEDKIYFFEGRLSGTILVEPSELRVEGFPIASLFFVEDWQMPLSKAHKFSEEIPSGFLSHREMAIKQSVDYLRKEAHC